MELHDLAESVSMIQYKLKNFKKVNTYLWNFSCPICGDSKRVSTRARGYIYVNTHDKNLWYKCHNCEYHKKYQFFLKDFDTSIYNEVVKNVYLNKGKSSIKQSDTHVDLTNAVFAPVVIEEEKSVLHELMLPVQKLERSHPARAYLNARKLPDISDLYYMDDISKMSNILPKYKEKLKNSKDGRIIIPYRNRKGVLIGFSMRSLKKHHPIKYLHVKLNENAPLIYNLDKINLSEKVIVTEGQFDSMFFRNAVSASGSSFGRVKDVIPKNQLCIVFDNETRHKETLRNIKKTIDDGYRVTLLPHNIKSKDVNDMILQGEVEKDGLDQYFLDNSYVGLNAKIKFTQWKNL